MRYRSSSFTGAAGFIAVLLFGLMILGGNWLIYSSTQETDVYEVTGAERVCSGSGESSSCQYLVYTTTDTLYNGDSLFAGKFRSSDWHGEFRRGGSFRLTTPGWRVGWLSWYPNIIRYERLENNAPAVPYDG